MKQEKKYHFYAVFKKGKATIAKTYYANSNNHAHTMRSGLIPLNPIFISPIQRMDNLGLPIFIKAKKRLL